MGLGQNAAISSRMHSLLHGDARGAPKADVLANIGHSPLCDSYTNHLGATSGTKVDETGQARLKSVWEYRGWENFKIKKNRGMPEFSPPIPTGSPLPPRTKSGNLGFRDSVIWAPPRVLGCDPVLR